MRKTVILLLTFLFLISYSDTIEAKVTTETIPQDQSPTIMELAFLRSLGTTILEIMNKHGDKQLFTSGRIEQITRDTQNDTYDISLRVIGFEGPLNPPYKLIRITIRIPGEYAKYKVISYKRKYISDDEFSKLSKYTGY